MLLEGGKGRSRPQQKDWRLLLATLCRAWWTGRWVLPGKQALPVAITARNKSLRRYVQAVQYTDITCHLQAIMAGMLRQAY